MVKNLHRSADRHRNVIAIAKEANAATDRNAVREVSVPKEANAVREDPVTEARATEHRAVMAKDRVTVVQDRVDMKEVIRKDQAASTATEKEIRVTDRRAADPDLIKQKAECSLALISQVGKVLAVGMALQQAAAAVLRITSAVAEQMAGRQIDSATASRAKALAEKLHPSRILKSRKKRDVSVRKKTNATKKTTSMKKKRH